MKLFEKETSNVFTVYSLYFSEIKKLLTEICLEKDYDSRDCYHFDKEYISPKLEKSIQLDDKRKTIEFNAPSDFEKILALRWSYVFNTSVCYTRNTFLPMNRLLILLSLAYKDKLSIQTPVVTFYRMYPPYAAIPAINEKNELVTSANTDQFLEISQRYSGWLKEKFKAQYGYHIFYMDRSGINSSNKYFIVCLNGKVFFEKINERDEKYMEFIIEEKKEPLESTIYSYYGPYKLHNKLEITLDEIQISNIAKVFDKKIVGCLPIPNLFNMIHAPGKHYQILMPTAFFEDTVLLMDHSDEEEGTPIRNLFLCNDGMSVNNALSVFKYANYDVMENKIKFATSKILAEKKETLLNEEESTRLLDKLPLHLQQISLPNNYITEGKKFIIELQKLLRNMQNGAKSNIIFFKEYYEENAKKNCDNYVEYFKENVWDKISPNVLKKLEEIVNFKELFDTYFGKNNKSRCLDRLSSTLQTILLKEQVAILDIFNKNDNGNNNVSVFTNWKKETKEFLEVNFRDCNSDINDGKTNLFLEELHIFVSKYFKKNDDLFLLWIQLKMQLIQARQEEHSFLTKKIEFGSDTTVLSIFGELKKFLNKANFLKKDDCAMTVIFSEEILTEIPQDKIVVCQSQHEEKIYTVFIQGSQQNVAQNSPLHDSILELKQEPTDAQCYFNFIKELIKNDKNKKLSFTTWAEKMVQFSLFCEIMSSKIDKSFCLILIDQGKILGQMIQTAFLLAMKFDSNNQKSEEDWGTLGQYRIMIEEFIQSLFNGPPLCKNIDNTLEFQNLISSIVDAVEKMNDPTVIKKLISILNNKKSEYSCNQYSYLNEKKEGLAKISGNKWSTRHFLTSISNENDIFSISKLN